MPPKQARLASLIKRLAKQAIYEALEEHLEEYSHKPRRLDPLEILLCEAEPT